MEASAMFQREVDLFTTSWDLTTDVSTISPISPINTSIVLLQNWKCTNQEI